MLLHLKKITVYFIFIAFVVSCGLKQPEFIPEAKIPVGSIFVTSNIPGARIFFNYDTTGQVTPDTVHNIPIGPPTIIQVYKDGYIVNPHSITVEVATDTIETAHFSLEFITDQGKLFFDSTPDGAEILVDRVFVGKFTPDTIIVAADTAYNFGLYKHGFDSLEIGNNEIVTNTLTLFDETLNVQKQVLIESFANSSCLPCTTTNTNIENFMAFNNPEHYSLIEYFTNFPSPFDPMYLHNRWGNRARFDTLYAINSVPRMFIAGSSVDATDYNSIQNSFNNQLINASVDVSISLSKQITDSLRVNVELNEFNSLPAGNWRLFIAVIEKEVVFATPPGANGLTKFSQVFRRFLTKPMGDVFTFSNNQFIKKFTASIHSEWDLTEIEIIGFIQNVDTKEVINSTHL